LERGAEGRRGREGEIYFKGLGSCSKKGWQIILGRVDVAVLSLKIILRQNSFLLKESHSLLLNLYLIR
jgi:hypothetical protein